MGHLLLIYVFPFIKSYILISQQAELDKAIDFLDPIDTDVPKGGKDPQLEIIYINLFLCQKGWPNFNRSFGNCVYDVGSWT